MQTNVHAQRDLDTLTALNLDYFASVQKGDVKRLDEIFADDFMCSTPDGSLLDKAEYLKLVAKPVTISGLLVTYRLIPSASYVVNFMRPIHPTTTTRP